MKRFNHVTIATKIDVEFCLASYSQGNRIYFFREQIEIGFIEIIAKSAAYLQTIYISFYDFSDALNNKIAERAKQLYKEQKSNFIKPTNVMLRFSNGTENELI